MASRIPLCIIAVALLLGVTSASLDDEAFETVSFGYSGANGPDHWGNLSPAFSACASGKKQSPVNILKNEIVPNKNLMPLTRDYKPANATLLNNGFNIGLFFNETVGSLLVNGKNYTFKQMHWHSPSEHLIDGEQFPAELHLVHKAADGSVSVVGILYQIGDADPLLAKLKKPLEKLTKESCGANEVAQVAVGTVDTKVLKRNTRKYYRYIGSLTTPPCTEGVTWTVLNKVRSISKDQVEALKAPLGDAFKTNARPCQPLNDRKIELFDELSNDN